MKTPLILLLCAAMLLCLAGCGREEAPYTPTGDALDNSAPATQPDASTPEENSVFALAYYPDRSLNPFQATDPTNRVLFSLLYQGLFAVDKNYQVVPMLCDTYNVSTDMKTYTFYLANAYFSDGTPITANDAAASLSAAKGSPWYGSRLQHVITISSYGTAVVLELDTPMENLPILLDIPIVKASEVNTAQPLGTGPYRYSGESLRRQAGWWCSGELPIDADTIPLVASQSPAQIRDDFEFRDVGLVCADPGRYDYVDFRSDHELWDCENGTLLYLVSHKESKFFADPAVRAALTHAIDRDSLSEEYYHGFAQAACLPASPSSPYYNQSLAQRFGYAPQKFIDAITAAAPESNKVTMLLCSDDLMRVRTGLAIEKMLESCGLDVNIVQVSSEDLVGYLLWSTYDLYLAQTKLSANMDISAFFGTNTSMNYGGLSDPALYALSLESLANSGNFYNLHQQVMEKGQLCPILFQNYAVYANRGKLSDLAPARDNIFFYDIGRTMKDALIKE